MLECSLSLLSTPQMHEKRFTLQLSQMTYLLVTPPQTQRSVASRRYPFIVYALSVDRTINCRAFIEQRQRYCLRRITFLLADVHPIATANWISQSTIV